MATTSERDKVIRLDPWHDTGGWVWTVESADGPTRRYRTDRDCEGLWVWVESGPGGEWRQTYGHMQVSWPADRAEMTRTLARPFRDVRPGYDVSAL